MTRKVGIRQIKTNKEKIDAKQQFIKTRGGIHAQALHYTGTKSVYRGYFKKTSKINEGKVFR